MTTTTVKKSDPSPSKMARIFKSIFKVVLFLVLTVIIAKALATLGAIHGKDLPESYFSGGYPTILGLLDSEVFMGLIFFITLSVFAYFGYLLWQLHEVAVHKAHSSSSPQIQLIFALSLCGLFIHKAWWVLAIIIAFTSWDDIASRITQIIHKGINDKPNSSNEGESS